MGEDMNKVDEASAKELQGRVDQFNKEFLPLLGKYELGLGAAPFILPNGTISARPVMVDVRKKKEEIPGKPDTTGQNTEGAVTAD